MADEIITIDPRELRLPFSRADGADPLKYARQLSKHGISMAGMPPIFVYRCPDGLYRIVDGVTRATRMAKLHPGMKITAQIIGDLAAPGTKFPSLESTL